MQKIGFLTDELWYGGVVFHADKYPISKNGRVSERGKWVTKDSLGLVTVFCNSCRVGWDATHTWVNTDDIVEIRGKGD